MPTRKYGNNPENNSFVLPSPLLSEGEGSFGANRQKGALPLFNNISKMPAIDVKLGQLGVILSSKVNLVKLADVDKRIS
ncbi:MAG: hypothetical protein AB1489_15425 [Acidobacteriota bacterium]